MRKLIYSIILTADGCVDHTKMTGSEEILDSYLNLVRDADLFVYGRVTYELMVPYWPDVLKDPSSTKSEIEYARAFTAVEKVVFSNSLDKVDGNSRIVRTKPEDEILKLKKQEGKNMLLGGVSLASHLIALGLVDEYVLFFQPLLVGKGKRLLDNISLKERLQLKLIDTKVLKSGCVVLHYGKP